MHDALRRRIDALASSTDPAEREIARRLLAAGRGHVQDGAGRDDERPPSRWVHVDLADMLSFFGNSVQARGGTLKSAHQPQHSSKSGACLVAWPGTGRWWCSSCRRAGDALAYVMTAVGSTHTEAAAWLTERYGPPAGPARPASLKRRAFRATLP